MVDWINNKVRRLRILKPKFLLTLLLFLYLQPSNSDVINKENYYSFTIPWNDNVENIIDLVDKDKVVPAGSHGVLRALDDRLVFEDGTGVKLWGIAITVSGKFPPKSKEDTQAIVNKLSKYGFNLVRINGLDFPGYRLYPEWSKTGRLNAEIIDRLDYFVYVLKQAGIYYSMSINNSSLKAKGLPGVAKNGHHVEHKRFKFIQLYDDRIIEKVLKWHGAFYGHSNPYTKTTYARDPANIYITAIGEDSIFNGYFNYRAKFLSDQNFEYLQRKFNGYLTEKYGSTKKMREAWGRNSDIDGKLENNSIRLDSSEDLDSIVKARAVDILEFLSQIDYSYANKIRKVMRGLGFKGLFAGTNDWYGYANIMVNQGVGDFIDMHGYFDPMIRKKSAEGFRELTRNTSYIAAPAGISKSSGVVMPFSRNFYKFFASAVEGMPLMITEWNHSAWSDYAYEGPLLLTAYSSLQGYAALAIHTYLSMGLSYKAEYSNNSLVANGNPVMMSLSPTLALAFRNSYIRESTDLYPIVVGVNKDQLFSRTLEDRLNKIKSKSGFPYNQGFLQKIRLRLIDDTGKQYLRKPMVPGQWSSDTAEISWNFPYRNRAVFSVNTPKFQTVAGRLDNVEIRLDSIKVSLADHGAVTAIALDDTNLDSSSSILVTAVSSFKNTDMVTAKLDRFRRWHDLKSIENVGTSPVMMKRVRGKFVLETANSKRAVVYAVKIDGSYEELPSTNHTSSPSSKHLIEFSLGGADTPWYWIKFDDKSS